MIKQGDIIFIDLVPPKENELAKKMTVCHH